MCIDKNLTSEIGYIVIRYEEKVVKKSSQYHI